MDRIFSRLKLLCFAIGSLGAGAIFFYQCLVWLRNGIWIPVSLDMVADFIRSIGSSWIGLQVIFDWVLAFPLSVAAFLLGLILFWFFDVLSARQDASTVTQRPAPSHLLKLSELGQKDRIQILLSEYAALRAEIMSRTGFGFQIAAVSLAGITWLMQQQLDNRPWYFWLIMVGVAGCFSIAIFVNVRDLTRAAHRIKELEYEINSRAGEHLLVWETLSGVVTRMSVTKSFFSPIKSFPRSKLPPLDQSYLLPDNG
jgi:hypothetical protein